MDPDDPRDNIEPDQPVTLTREDWRDGFDAALAFIVVYVP